MPVKIIAVPEAEFNQWVISKGGKLPDIPAIDANEKAGGKISSANAPKPKNI